MTETSHVTDDRTQAVRRLTRTREGRVFGGVCAGLGRYFDVSPTIYRLAFAALALAGGTGILLYLAAWLVIPDDDAEASIAETALRDHRERPALAVGVGLIGLAAIVIASHAAFWPHPGNIWLAALLVGGGLVWWELHGRRPATAPAPQEPQEPAATPPPPVPAARQPSLFLPVVGTLLVAAGVAGLLEALDVWSVEWRILLGASIAFVGAAVVVGAATGRRVAGLIGVALILLPALALSLAVDVPLRGGVGDRTERPLAVSSLDRDYRLAIGDLRLDLGDLQLPAGTTSVDASVGVGRLTVVVPEDVTVDVAGHAGIGDVVFFGHHESGAGVDRHAVYGSGPRRLDLNLDVGLGDVEVRTP